MPVPHYIARVVGLKQRRMDQKADARASEIKFTNSDQSAPFMDCGQLSSSLIPDSPDLVQVVRKRDTAHLRHVGK